MLNLVNDFGADPTGVANCDAAVAAWLDTGKDCEVPAGDYRVCGSGDVMFTQTKPGVLVGEYQKSRFVLDNAVPSTRSFLKVKLDPSYKGRGVGLYQIVVEPETYGIGIGKHSVIWATTSSGEYMRQPFIEKCGFGALSAQAIVSVNNNQNGLLMARIIACPFILGGIALNNCGDSIQIKENIIAGNGIGIFASPVPGATRLAISYNNISSIGGCIYLLNPNTYSINDNNMEQNQGYNGGVGAMVFVQGANGGNVSNNQFQSMGLTSCLRRIDCINDRAVGNFMLARQGTYHVWDAGGAGYVKDNTYIDFDTGNIVGGYFG